MKRTLIVTLLIATPAYPQTQIRPEIRKEQAAPIVRVAVPRPDTTLPLEAIDAPFFAPLTRDLAASGVFAIAPIPPNVPPNVDLAKAASADFVLALRITQDEQDYVLEARFI